MNMRQLHSISCLCAIFIASSLAAPDNQHLLTIPPQHHAWLAAACEQFFYSLPEKFRNGEEDCHYQGVRRPAPNLTHFFHLKKITVTMPDSLKTEELSPTIVATPFMVWSRFLAYREPDFLPLKQPQSPATRWTAGTGIALATIATPVIWYFCSLTKALYIFGAIIAPSLSVLLLVRRADALSSNAETTYNEIFTQGLHNHAHAILNTLFYAIINSSLEQTNSSQQNQLSRIQHINKQAQETMLSYRESEGSMKLVESHLNATAKTFNSYPQIFAIWAREYIKRIFDTTSQTK